MRNVQEIENVFRFTRPVVKVMRLWKLSKLSPDEKRDMRKERTRCCTQFVKRIARRDLVFGGKSGIHPYFLPPIASLNLPDARTSRFRYQSRCWVPVFRSYCQPLMWLVATVHLQSEMEMGCT
jgi:hypothetical protein